MDPYDPQQLLEGLEDFTRGFGDWRVRYRILILGFDNLGWMSWPGRLLYRYIQIRGVRSCHCTWPGFWEEVLERHLRKIIALFLRFSSRCYGILVAHVVILHVWLGW